MSAHGLEHWGPQCCRPPAAPGTRKLAQLLAGETDDATYDLVVREGRRAAAVVARTHVHSNQERAP